MAHAMLVRFKFEYLGKFQIGLKMALLYNKKQGSQVVSSDGNPAAENLVIIPLKNSLRSCIPPEKRLQKTVF